VQVKSIDDALKLRRPEMQIMKDMGDALNTLEI